MEHMKNKNENEAEKRLKSALDEEVTVTLTRFELKKIRDWNLQRMESSRQALDNMLMKPAKRSRWQAEYDFHSLLCDHLHGVDPDEEDRIREHNESVRSQIGEMERVLADVMNMKAQLQKQLI